MNLSVGVSLLERNLFRLAQAVLAGVAIYYAATIVSLLTSSEAEARFVVPASSGVDSSVRVSAAAGHAARSHYAVISERSVFNAPKAPEPEKVKAPVSLPPLRATLLGVAPGEEGGFAVIEDPSTREQRLLRVGKFFQERELVEIDRNRVVFRSESGRETTLSLPLPPAEIQGRLQEPKVDDGTPRHAESVLWQVVSLSPVKAPRTQRPMARFSPEFEDGELEGVRISGVVPNSEYHRFGFKNGDLVISVDDESFANPLEALRVLRGLPEQSSGIVSISRRGELLALDLSAPPAGIMSSGKIDGDAGPMSTWDWRKEERSRAAWSPPRLPPLRQPDREIIVTSMSDVRELDLWSDTEISSSKPSDWKEEDLIPISVRRTSDLAVSDEPSGSAVDDSELPQIKVTDMRLVHRGLIDLHHNDG